eukprot:EG_transcript_19326
MFTPNMDRANIISYTTAMPRLKRPAVLAVRGRMHTKRPNGASSSATCAKFSSGSAQCSTWDTSRRPRARTSARRSLRWSTTWSAPSARQWATVSGREAVATTVAPRWRFAIWMPMEPTPPAPPTMRMVGGGPWWVAVWGWMPAWSMRPSQAVRDVRGRAAASAKVSVAGLRPTMRLSTATHSALQPRRMALPAKNTSSPTLNRPSASGPTASTTPAQSQPVMVGAGPCLSP